MLDRDKRPDFEVMGQTYRWSTSKVIGRTGAKLDVSLLFGAVAIMRFKWSVVTTFFKSAGEDSIVWQPLPFESSDIYGGTFQPRKAHAALIGTGN